ncbi:hypothetical protein ACWGJP_08430 [Microbacterium sp. NPDC055903]
MSASETAAHTPWGRVVGIGVALSLVVGVILLAFAWPSITASPTDLPVGIVGTDDQVEQLEDAVAEQSDGAVALQRYDDREDAVAAIEQREAYGAVVLGAEMTDAPEVLKATAASAQVAAVMDGLARQLQSQIDGKIRTQIEQTLTQAQEGMAAAVQAAVQAALSGRAPTAPGDAAAVELPEVTVVVTDIAPFSEDDPNGAGLTVAMFPMLLGGMMGGIVLTLLVKGTARRLIGVVVYSAAAGLVLSGVLHSWLGALPAGYWLNAAALALTIAAISATITGLGGLFGAVGVPIGAVLMMLVANPIAAATVPVEFLVSPWGAIGQLMPPGAAGTLLRSISYFPDADVTAPWLVLGIWTVVGLALTAVDLPARRTRAAEAVSERAGSTQPAVA